MIERTAGELEQVRVLLVEDNVLDAKSVLSTAKRAKVAVDIHHVEDGQAALDYLAEHPVDLVLLDLNLPGLDGHDVLKAVRTDDRTRTIPVVILTTSEEESDVARSYDLGANAFVTKPVGLDGWATVVSQIEGFWLTLAKLPRSR